MSLGPVSENVTKYVAKLKRSPDRPANFDALAALAVSLAGTIDSGGTGGAMVMGLAAIARELRATLDELAPGDADDDALAFLAKLASRSAVGNTPNRKPRNPRTEGR